MEWKPWIFSPGAYLVKANEVFLSQQLVLLRTVLGNNVPNSSVVGSAIIVGATVDKSSNRARIHQIVHLKFVEDQDESVDSLWKQSAVLPKKLHLLDLAAPFRDLSLPNYQIFLVVELQFDEGPSVVPLGYLLLLFLIPWIPFDSDSPFQRFLLNIQLFEDLTH